MHDTEHAGDFTAKRTAAADRLTRRAGEAIDNASYPTTCRDVAGLLTLKGSPGMAGLRVVPLAGFEPATHGLGNRCSIP